MFLDLRNGGRTLIDDELFDKPLTLEVWAGQFFTFRICDCSWRHKDRYRVPYVQTVQQRSGKLCCIRLHRLIMQAAKGSIVDHVNRDVLDNRADNLRICDHSTNNLNRSKHHRGRNGVYVNSLTGEQFLRTFVNGKESLASI